MTPRMALAAWGAALALVAALVAGLMAVPLRRDIPALPPGVPVVVIGSSMTGHAVPLRPPPGGLLGDGRRHARWHIGGITEARTQELLDGAIAAGARTVLVEANAFATGGQGAVRNRSIAARMDRALAALTERIEAALASLDGRGVQPVNRQEPRLDPRPWFPEREDLARIYPFRLRAPSDPQALAQAVARARAQGTEVVFFEPPRPASVVAAMGPDGHAAYIAHLQAMAGDYGVAFIHFGRGWPDSLFRDRTHLSRDGRARFLAELPALWEARK